MGDIIGGLIGGIGSLIGGSQGAGDALKGYNYLTSGKGAAAESGYVNNGGAANTAQSQLLGLSPITGQTQNGFNNYLNSTGYNFQRQQGSDALTGSAAARGLLNSGSTAKALTAYGQNLAAGSFNNYLGQLGGVSQAGQTGLGQVSQAGTQGGAAAGQAQQSGTSSGFNQLGSAAGGLANAPNGTLTNFFGGL